MWIEKFFTLFKEKSFRPKSTLGLEGVQLADAIFHNLSAEQKVPGIVVTVSNKGKIILQKGYGHANLESKLKANPKDQLFRIASISKCITGIALGKMVEDGILNWEDSIYKYVPDFPQKNFDFTVKQLASHTAGIRGYRGKEFALNQNLSIKDSIEVFKNDPLQFQPGNGYLYNSFDFVLLSLAMQNAAGISFEEYVKTMVLKPLKLNNTVSPTTNTAVQFYTKTPICFKKAIEVNNAYKIAGGGYLSTSEDVAKLGEEIRIQSLLHKNTYQELLSSQLVQDNPTYYGLGFQVSHDAKGRPFYGHVGSSVGAYSNLFVYPNEKKVFSILINCTDPKVQEHLDLAINAILESNN
ncbi:serine hydrolase [Croceivirga lutea]|uniref:serine hydrolase domain-containing protein n=1 Tax=Croceivirga lutea TaxID=1775167 RepID=UPI0016396E6A|nr:serine hydrolase domain-containing protein [Croceivirga lutea]GGG53553.1 serine hydrolase [Croceivirga lutea]